MKRAIESHKPWQEWDKATQNIQLCEIINFSSQLELITVFDYIVNCYM